MAQTVSGPLPWKAAREVLANKRLLPTTLSSADLDRVGASLRRGSLFSAKVAEANLLETAFGAVAQIVDPTLTGQTPGSYMDRAKAREILKGTLAGMGYDPEKQGVTPGGLQDLSSDARLNLVIDTNAEMISNQARAIAGNDEDVLDAFPCWELVRVSNFSAETRGTARDWPGRWRANGGRFFGGGRMIARKDDPIWTAISRFGNPYAPFDYGSGMGQREVARGEAIRVGAISRQDAPPRPRPLDDLLGTGPQASVGSLPKPLADALADALGDAFEIVGGILRLRGGA